MPAQSWLYTCAVPVMVLGQCTNAHLPSIGGDLVPENTAFVQVHNDRGVGKFLPVDLVTKFRY